MSRGAQYNVNRSSTDSFYRYKMPAITTKIEGRGNGIKTVVENCSAVAEALNRPPQYVAKHFGFELGAQVQMDPKNDKYIVNGQHPAELLQDKLDIFIKNWVLCESCDNPETSLKVYGPKKKPCIDASCKACGTVTTLNHQGRMRKYIEVNPPENFVLKNKGTMADGEEGDGGKSGKKGKNRDKKQSGDSNKKEGASNEGPASTELAAAADFGDEITTATDVHSRLDRHIKGALTSKLGDLSLNDGGMSDLIGGLDLEVKMEAFQRNIKKVKKRTGKEDFLNEDSAEEVAKIAKCLQLGAYSVIAFNEYVEFSGKMLDQVDKYKHHLAALCGDDKKIQNTVLGLYEMKAKEHKKLLPLGAHICKKLYDEDIVDEDVILEWAAKPSKKYTSKKFVEKILAEETMKKFLEWLKEDESSSEEEESSEEESEEEEAAAETKPQTNGEAPASEEPVAQPAAESNNFLEDDKEDDESDIDIDDI